MSDSSSLQGTNIRSSFLPIDASTVMIANRQLPLFSQELNHVNADYVENVSPIEPLYDEHHRRIRLQPDYNKMLTWTPRAVLTESVQMSRAIRESLWTRQKYRSYALLRPLDERYVDLRANIEIVKNMLSENVRAYERDSRNNLEQLWSLYLQTKQSNEHYERSVASLKEKIEKLSEKMNENAQQIEALRTLQDENLAQLRDGDNVSSQQLANIENENRATSRLIASLKATLAEMKENATQITTETRIKRSVEKSLDDELRRALDWPRREQDVSYDATVQRAVDEKLRNLYTTLSRERENYVATMRDRFQNLVDEDA